MYVTLNQDKNRNQRALANGPAHVMCCGHNEGAGPTVRASLGHVPQVARLLTCMPCLYAMLDHALAAPAVARHACKRGRDV